jgi:integrase
MTRNPKGKKDYPPGTKFGEWYLAEETEKHTGSRVWTIRRMLTTELGKRSQIRLPLKVYRTISQDESKLKDLVIRLNNQIPEEQRTRKVVEIKHAFISEALLEKYFSYLKSQIPNQDNARKAYTYSRRYFLEFFITKMDMANPAQWHRNQTIWAHALMNQFPKGEYSSAEAERIRLWEKGRTPVASTLREIVNNANRFMRWLHQERRGENELFEFEPISKAALKTMEARRSLTGLVKRKWFIKDDDWDLIVKKASSDILPAIWLGYHFGLRRAETMGFELTDVKRGFLLVERQLDGLPSPDLPEFDILKGKKQRKVPYCFFAKGDDGPLQAYKWIQKMQVNRMHPDTLSKRWDELMEKLEMPYELHDLRRTWITRCFRLPGMMPTDIQLAAGHTNIETTMRYKLDDRSLDEENFVPEE